MASAGDIMNVRTNVNEPTDDLFSDEAIGALVDISGVAGASAAIWRQKAAIAVDLVNTSEAGSSRALSDIHKNALAMASTFDSLASAEMAEAAGKQRARIHKITRT